MMHDMTTGPIRGHVLRMMAFMLVFMVVQTLYSLIDIYWVGRLGKEAIAAVSLSANLMFISIAISQMIAVGTVAMVSQAAGRKDQDEVQRLFNQSNSLSVVVTLFAGVLGYAFKHLYVDTLASDAQTAALANSFLDWFLPAVALQFCMVGLGSSLRGIGNMKPGTVASVGSVLLNMVLAPFLIFGWLGFPQMGVAGAGLATLIATIASIVGLVVYLARKATFLRVDFAQWIPDWKLWGRMLMIGLPAGSEFILMSIILGLIYVVIRPFGPEAQGGFGVGMRIMQAGFLPAVCLAFGAAAVAGQNYGAKKFDRVRGTFVESAKLAIGFMIFFTFACHLAPEAMVRVFSKEPGVVAVGSDYLRFISYNYVASALIMISGAMFQGLGNTWPSLAASASRLVLFIAPVIWLSHQPGFNLHQVWWTSVTSVALQATFSLLLLRREFRRKLTAPAPIPAAVAVAQ
jgi:putative MATE family efflux protein